MSLETAGQKEGGQSQTAESLRESEGRWEVAGIQSEEGSEEVTLWGRRREQGDRAGECRRPVDAPWKLLPRSGV